jgi:hypothetical protein
MKPEHFSRHEQYLKTAKQIELAHRSYLEAMRAIEDEKDDATIYAHIKKANAAIESAFPEKFNPPARPPSIKANEEKRSKNLLLILGVAFAVLGVLLLLTLFGPTGDMTKNWNPEEVQKNTVYPRSQ